MLFVIDDEIISSLNYENYGVSTLYGNLLEWLIKAVHEAVEETKAKLPPKAVKKGFPQLYWCPAFSHKRFGRQLNLRNKYNLCLTSILKLYPSMRLMQFKKIWDFDDDSLILNNGNYTPIGKGVAWQAIDNALKFNVEKKEEFMARILINQRKNRFDITSQRGLVEKSKSDEKVEDQVQAFLERRNDRFHWNAHKGNRFMLPCPDRRH